MLHFLKHPLPEKINDRFDANVIDAAKGALIILVVLGHASNFWSPEPHATFSIKFFHVACFLLLPFVYDIRPISLTFIKDRIARYYIPFLLFLCGYGILNLLMFRGFNDTVPWLIDLGKAAIVANAPMLDAASALRALWFLPALFATVILTALLIGRLKIPLWCLLIVSVAVHLTIGILPDHIKFSIPMGVVSVLYLFALGIILRTICIYTPRAVLEKYSPLFLITAVLGIAASAYFDTLIKFPVIALPDYTNLKAVIIHDAIIIGVFLFLITTPIFQKQTFLKWCGQNSLIIYLSHLLFLAASMQITTQYFDPSHINLTSSGVVMATFLIALSGGIACAMIINKLSILQACITPRTWAEWPPVKGIKK